MTKNGWGLVGTGRIADDRILPGINAHAGNKLVAIVSRDQGRADTFAKKFGAQHAYTSFDEMLRNPEVTVVASDADGGPVALRLVAPPAWAGLNGTVIRLAPDFDVVSRLEGSKEFLLTVEASDGSLTAQASIVVTVLHTNRAPVLEAISDRSVLEGTTETLEVSASDPDSDPLALSLVSAPSFVTLAENGDGTGTLTISPSLSDAGGYGVTLQVSDGSFAAQVSFLLTVLEAAVAGDFSLSVSPTAASVGAGGTAFFTVTLTALEGFSGPVTLSVPDLPAGWASSFCASTCGDTFTPTAGGLEITWSVTTTPSAIGSFTLSERSRYSAGLK